MVAHDFAEIRRPALLLQFDDTEQLGDFEILWMYCEAKPQYRHYRLRLDQGSDHEPIHGLDPLVVFLDGVLPGPPFFLFKKRIGK